MTEPFFFLANIFILVYCDCNMSTGIIYDDIFLKHNLPGHPEHAGRLKAIITYLNKKSLFDKCVILDARPASIEELLTCHDQSLVSLLEDFGKNGLAHIDLDTYMNEFSYEAALKAVGGIIDLAGKIIDNELANGIVLSRPPGHHATASRAMGFCLFNTIALGARSCIIKRNLKKVAIIDIDVHHGNGTQWIFYNDPAVFYISTHQYPHYPGSGGIKETGEGMGKGTTLNIPFPEYTGDKGYNKAAEELIIPALRKFKPEFLFVSVGFDAHSQDPLSSIQLSLSGYNNISRALISLADEICHGRIIFNLEGGYNLDVLGPGCGNIIRGLIGDITCDDPFLQGKEKTEKTDEMIGIIKQTHNL